MTMEAFFVKHCCFVKLNAIRPVLVIGYKIMEIGFGCNADGKDHQHCCSVKFLYDSTLCQGAAKV